MSKWLLITGAVLGVIVAVLVNWHISKVESAQRAVSFLRLKPDVTLAKGQQVTGSMLTAEFLPEKFKSLTKLAIADNPASRQWIEGRPVTKDIPAGSLMLHEYFLDDPGKRFAASITKGMRAMSVRAQPTTAVAFFVQPGSRVDFVGTFTRREQLDIKTRVPTKKGSSSEIAIPAIQDIVETKIILQNVKVLAVDRATTRVGYQRTTGGRGFATVTIEVSPEDAEKVIFANTQSNEPLSLILRHPDDNATVEIPSATWESLNK